MAPIGHTPSGHRGTRESYSNSPSNWLDAYGHREYQSWRDENPTQHVSYDEWKTSNHANGLSLYYATLRIFEESDSSVSIFQRIIANAVLDWGYRMTVKLNWFNRKLALAQCVVNQHASQRKPLPTEMRHREPMHQQRRQHSQSQKN